MERKPLRLTVGWVAKRVRSCGVTGPALGVGRRRLVEGDAQADFDVPAGDADFLDEQSQELLFLVGVELVDHAADPFGEVVDSAVDLAAAPRLARWSARLPFAAAGGDGRW